MPFNEFLPMILIRDRGVCFQGLMDVINFDRVEGE